MPPLTKSEFVSGARCLKKVWWEVHEPDAPELRPDASLQWRFEQGKEVGLRARLEIPGARYEASLATGELYARADILEPLPDGRQGLTEVKATKSVKDEHLADAAFQSYVAGQVGLDLGRVELMHLNPECRHPDLSNLFTRAEITAEVAALQGDIPGTAAAIRKALEGHLPEVALGPQCFSPEVCPFLDRCWPRPAHHVSTLYYLKKSKALELERGGHASVTTLPPTLKLSAIQARQQRAVAGGEMIVEPGLGAALAAWPRPLVYLDFETVTFAIPRFPGTGPWDQIPVQYSAHVERAGEFFHHAFLAEGAGDPRPALAAALVEACAGAGSVVAYFSTFEDGCLAQLAAAVPEHAVALEAIRGKLVDLLPVVRNHVYHPDFNGSFSLKSVLPAMLPNLSYDDLVIRDGETAQAELCRMLYGATMPAGERARLRQDLLAYCERDTWAMVALMERLRELGD
jgi:hypothetical protein